MSHGHIRRLGQEPAVASDLKESDREVIPDLIKIKVHLLRLGHADGVHIRIFDLHGQRIHVFSSGKPFKCLIEIDRRRSLGLAAFERQAVMFLIIGLHDRCLLNVQILLQIAWQRAQDLFLHFFDKLISVHVLSSLS